MAAAAGAVIKQIKIPVSYSCSITAQIMLEPVFTDDGQTYEREAIEEWLKTHDTSPKTGEKLRSKELRTNWDKKGDISEFLNEHPELYERDEVYLPKSWVGGLVTKIKANQVKEVQEYLAKDKRLLILKLEEDYTAFHLACQFGSAELTNILLENLIKRNELDKILSQSPVGFKPAHLNALLEKSLVDLDKSKFSLLLKLGAEISPVEEGTQNTLLHKLAIQGNSEAVNWLLDRGLNIESQNVEGNTPLLLSVIYGHLALTELLLKRGANRQAKNSQKESPISIALLKQNKPMLTLLVGPEKVTLPPLHLAIELNDFDLIKTLLKQASVRASLETPGPFGRTPFYALAAKDSKEMKEKEEAAKLLLEAGANPAIVYGTEKLTLLHVAAQQGDLAMLKLLLQSQAASLINRANIHGDTPLHMAARSAQDGAIPLLLEAGADHETKNKLRKTPMALARQQGQARTAELIEETARALKRAKFEEIGRLRQEMDGLLQVVKEQARQLEQQAKHFEQLEQERIREQVASREQARRFEQLEKELVREKAVSEDQVEQLKL